ncbi:MAG: rpsU-divergently transcribed protein [Hyphomonadaceae bacterium]|nr:MAG: rpsU-divergently transcribed protein [Hyphomonadaceae bacterium]
MENQTKKNKKSELLFVLLDEALFGGLSAASLRKAAANIGLSKGETEIIAPNGVISMIDYWFSLADNAMVASLSASNGLKIRQKATLAIRSRLEFLRQHKEALRHSIVQLALPHNARRGVEIGYRFADAAWRAFGDTSTDFNYYSKRTILLGVDLATATFFLGDDSRDNQDTWAFLDRRIENIMQFEKAKAKLRKLKEKLPDPIPFISKLRFGARPLP